MMNFSSRGCDQSFADSACVSCGACSQTCPTGAITDVFRAAPTVPEKTERTVCSYCGVGCNLEVAVADNQILAITAPETAEVNSGHTCLKGRYAFGFYNHPDRLQSPLLRRNGRLEPASWDEAYDRIIAKLKQLIAEHGPDSIAGISSARCTNEENYLMQKFIRAVVGTNNIDCCARVCHAPTAYGMQQAFGTGAATNSIDDIAHTDLLLIHPRDAQARQIDDQQFVQLVSQRGQVRLRAQISTEVKPGTLYTTFHFPELLVNRITSDVSDTESMCPEYKVTAVEVLKG